jgi:voltage-gated potassium channel
VTPGPPTAREIPAVRLPRDRRSPFAILGRRLIWAVLLTLFVALIAYLERDGYRDNITGEPVGLLDCVYYATVSITTTGYGDIVPVTDGARLATAFLVTPARILFLILLVGTTVELLAERTRDAVRQRLWRARLKDHVIVCGYGTKGRTAVDVLLGKGFAPGRIVVIDQSPEAAERASEAELAVVVGDATTSAALRHAGIETAQAVIVAPDRDDTAVLITLTAREHNAGATITSAVRESENVHLLHQSGATSVITSSAAAGRLLGLATDSPRTVEVLEDLLSVGEGLDIVEREVGPDDAGPRGHIVGNDLLIGVVRGGELLRFDDRRTAELVPGDRVICLRSHAEGA